MKKRILIILSIIFVLAGLMNCFWFLFYNMGTDDPWLITMIYVLSPYHFSYVFEDYRLNWGSASYSFNLLTLYLYLSFLAGALTYALSKGRELRLIKFNYSLILLSFLINSPFIIARLFIPDENNPSLTAKDSNLTIYLLYMLRALLLFIVAYKALAFFKKEATLELSVEEDGSGRQEEYLLQATKSQRLVNHLVDHILIAIYMITTLKAAINFPLFYNFLKDMEQSLGKELALILIFLTAKFLYFFIFEALCAASPGKMLSQTRVSDKSGNKAGVISILKRTLCRLIPFEPFTFLTGSNLHDERSDTYVIREQQKGVASSVYLWIMLPAFLLIIVLTAISNYLN